MNGNIQISRDTRGRGHELPHFDWLDLAAFAAGLFGTAALIVLAGDCTGDVARQGGSASCALRIALAGAVFLITMVHTVALLLLAAVDYHGWFERLTAWVLIGVVAVATVTSVLIG